MAGFDLNAGGRFTAAAGAAPAATPNIFAGIQNNDTKKKGPPGLNINVAAANLAPADNTPAAPTGQTTFGAFAPAPAPAAAAAGGGLFGAPAPAPAAAAAGGGLFGAAAPAAAPAAAGVGLFGAAAPPAAAGVGLFGAAAPAAAPAAAGVGLFGAAAAAPAPAAAGVGLFGAAAAAPAPAAAGVGLFGAAANPQFNAPPRPSVKDGKDYELKNIAPDPEPLNTGDDPMHQRVPAEINEIFDTMKKAWEDQKKVKEILRAKLNDHDQKQLSKKQAKDLDDLHSKAQKTKRAIEGYREDKRFLVRGCMFGSRCHCCFLWHSFLNQR